MLAGVVVRVSVSMINTVTKIKSGWRQGEGFVSGHSPSLRGVRAGTRGSSRSRGILKEPGSSWLASPACSDTPGPPAMAGTVHQSLLKKMSLRLAYQLVSLFLYCSSLFQENSSLCGGRVDKMTNQPGQQDLLLICSLRPC